MANERKRRKLIRPYELLLLIFALLLIVYFVLQSLGVDSMKRSEEVSFLDRSNGPSEPIRRDSRYDESTDAVVKELAERFADSDERMTNTKALREKGLSEEEAKFYKNVKQSKSDDNLSAAEWVGILQGSLKTYNTLKAIFDEADGVENKEVNEQTIEFVFSNPTIKTTVFNEIEQHFGIPNSTLNAFAARGSRALSDWATFVDQNKQQ